MAEQDPQTRTIRIQAERSPHKEHAVPLFITSSFVFDDAVFMERDVRIQAPVQWRLLLTKPLWLTESDKSAAAANQYYRPLQLAPLAASSQWFGGSALPCQMLPSASASSSRPLVALATLSASQAAGA